MKIFFIEEAMESGRHKRFLLIEESPINQLDRIFRDTFINKYFEITESSNCTLSRRA